MAKIFAKFVVLNQYHVKFVTERWLIWGDVGVGAICVLYSFAIYGPSFLIILLMIVIIPSVQAVVIEDPFYYTLIHILWHLESGVFFYILGYKTELALDRRWWQLTIPDSGLSKERFFLVFEMENGHQRSIIVLFLTQLFICGLLVGWYGRWFFPEPYFSVVAVLFLTPLVLSYDIYIALLQFLLSVNLAFAFWLAMGCAIELEGDVTLRLMMWTVEIFLALVLLDYIRYYDNQHPDIFQSYSKTPITTTTESQKMF